MQITATDNSACIRCNVTQHAITRAQYLPKFLLSPGLIAFKAARDGPCHLMEQATFLSHDFANTMMELNFYTASSSAKKQQGNIVRILYFSDKAKLILAGFKHKYFHFIDRKISLTNKE